MVTRLLILAALLAGCEKRSALYCEKNPEDLAHCPSTDAPEVPQVMCTDNSMCTQGDKLLCNTASNVCVGCLSNADCTDPLKDNCDPGSGTCRGCVVHADCPSDVCLPGGTCGDDSNTIYLDADAGSDTGDGTKAKPLKTFTKAVTFLTTARKYIKVKGTTNGSVTLDTITVGFVLLGDPGAKIVGAMDPALKLSKVSAKIYDLEITCGGANISGITVAGMSSVSLEHVYQHACGKVGINVTDGFFGLARSTIESNGDGVVTGKAAFVIVNNIIARNGSASAAHGGVELGSLTATNRFEFNTIADNAAVGGLTGNVGGVNCPGSLTSSLLIPNNLIVGNTGGSGNVGGACDTTGSGVDTDSTKWMFKSQAAAPYDYHLTAASTMAIDMATTPTAVTDDIDGQLRPQGAQRDYGADEFKP